MKLKSVIRPGVVYFVPLAVSAAAWSVPGESMFLRGFAQRTEINVGGLILLVGWYLVCFAFFVVGSRAGKAVLPLVFISGVENRPEFERFVARILTVLATVGVLYALFLAQQQGSVLAALAQSSGNDLSEPLKDGAGVATMRYTTVVATPFALVLFLRKKISWYLPAWNVALLLIGSLFSSRMSLLMAIVIFVYLYCHSDASIRIRFGRTSFFAIGIFAVLAALNFFRNARYYVSYDVHDPILMNWYQILTYLGSPFQVSSGVADAIVKGLFDSRGGFAESLSILVPTFLQDKSVGAIAGSESRYANQVDVAGNLTTNSAFADLYNGLGWWGLIWSLLAVLVAGFVFGHCKQYRSSMALAAGLSLYLLAEYWRIFLFNQGIVIYLFLCIFSCSIFSAFMVHRKVDTVDKRRVRRPLSVR